MKTIEFFKNTLIAIASSMLLCVSCTPFDELNLDPTRLNEATPGSFINPVLYNVAKYNWNRHEGYTYPLMHSVVSTSSTSGAGWWDISNSAGDDTWSTYYRYLTNINQMYTKAQELNQPNYMAVAMTLRCWMFQILTDAFGDIPMSEACRGEEGIFTPKFDTQKEVYQELIKQLDEANSLYDLEQGLVYNTGGEMLYGASLSDKTGIENWKKFTNSLRLRVLLRVLDVEGLNAASELKKMFADSEIYPIFTSNSEAAMLSISGVDPESQPILRPSDFTVYRSCSTFFLDPLNKWNDPRRAVFASKVTNESGEEGYFGIEAGYDILPANIASSPLASLCEAPMDLAMLSYAEVEFIRAELAQKGVINDSAEEAYERAVEAAITMWGVEMPAEYFDNEEAAYDGTLEKILQQKFYGLFFCDYQQWFEYNRTGIPVIPRGKGIADGNDIPNRFKYPATIQQTNGVKYQEAKQNMGGDDLNISLIWQKR